MAAKQNFEKKMVHMSSETMGCLQCIIPFLQLDKLPHTHTHHTHHTSHIATHLTHILNSHICDQRNCKRDLCQWCGCENVCVSRCDHTTHGCRQTLISRCAMIAVQEVSERKAPLMSKRAHQLHSVTPNTSLAAWQRADKTACDRERGEECVTEKEEEKRERERAR